MKNRTIIDLLKLMRSRQDLFTLGLCTWPFKLRVCELISDMEYYALKSFISENIPDTSFIGLFCWIPDDIEPRLKWIDEQIEKLGKDKLK